MVISAIVLSYNSSDFIVECLDSIYFQTYADIELIVTDDGSSDGTVSVVNEWLKGRESRFIEVKVVNSRINTGTSANANRGLQASNGEWIKFLAADDLLVSNAMDLYVDHVKRVKAARFIFAKYLYYSNGKIQDRYYYARGFFRKSVSCQQKQLLREIGVNSATSFIHRKSLLDLGGFDEKFELLEDAPLWLKASLNGYKLYGFEHTTVLYRIHTNNTCLGNNEAYINERYHHSRLTFFNLELSSRLLSRFYIFSWWNYYINNKVNDIVVRRGNRKIDLTIELRLLLFLNPKRWFGFNGFFNKHTNKDEVTYNL